jgi:hypothetical protein
MRGTDRLVEARAPDTRLGHLLLEATRGRFPPADFAVELLDPPAGQVDAVVAFTGHNLIAAAVDAGDVRAQLHDEDPGGPMSPRFLTWLSSRLGTDAGTVDVVLVADHLSGAGSLSRLRRVEAEAHPRLRRALTYRSDVEAYVEPDSDGGLMILGRGLAGRLEVSIEVHPARRGRGFGAKLARLARTVGPTDQPIFAQVAAGNAASIRAFIAAGYRPICSEVLFLRLPTS